MSNWTNPYDLLGVDRGATTGQIRAAYVELMKRHHPDISQCGTKGSEALGYVADLNAAFAVLRDHRKRADYDMQLASASAARLVAVDYPAPSPRVDRRRRLQALIGLGAAVAAVAAVSLVDLSPLRSFVFPQRDLGMADIADHAPATSITLDADDARRMVAAAISLPDEDAVGSSRKCFFDAMAVKRPEAVANCVVFDNAVLLWNWRGGGEGSITPYFQLRNARSRHLDALAEWRSDRYDVLDRLWSATLVMMVNQVRATLVEPPSPELVAKATAGVPHAAPARQTPSNPIMARP